MTLYNSLQLLQVDSDIQEICNFDCLGVWRFTVQCTSCSLQSAVQAADLINRLVHGNGRLPWWLDWFE